MRCTLTEQRPTIEAIARDLRGHTGITHLKETTPEDVVRCARRRGVPIREGRIAHTDLAAVYLEAGRGLDPGPAEG